MQQERNAGSVPTAEEVVSLVSNLVAQISEKSAERDRERSYPLAELDALRMSGILGARVPTSYGGPGATFRQVAEIMLLLGQADPSLAQAVSGNYMLDFLLIEGNEHQRRWCFSEALRGHVFIHALAERGGKFVGDIRTMLDSKSEGYRLSGTKHYCTGSVMCDILLSTAKLHDGTMCYVIVPRDRAGVEIVDDWDGMGQRTSASGRVTYSEVAIDINEVIPIPHWQTTRNYFGASYQLIHAALDAGIARAAFEDAVKYAKEKARPVPESGVSEQSKDPYVMHAVGRMKALIDSAEVMVFRAANFVDSVCEGELYGSPKGDHRERMLAEASIAVAEAKVISSDVALEVCTSLFEVGGASASRSKVNLDRHWRNARTHTLHDPVSYKYSAIGDFCLNEVYPPISSKY